MIETGENSKQNLSTDKIITKFLQIFYLGVTNLYIFYIIIFIPDPGIISQTFIFYLFVSNRRYL